MGSVQDNETVVTVRGRAEHFHPAERAVVHVQVGLEGPERSAVVTATTEGTAALVAGVRGLREAGPVTWFASDRLRVWADRPFNDKGEQKPLVHHASTATRVKFRVDAGADAMARWVEAASRHRGVRIDRIEWLLTDATRAGLVDEVRTRAVGDARAKAATYAGALGLTELRCTAVADEGMLGDESGSAHPSPTTAASARAGGGHQGGLSFTPEDIAVSAVVDARFAAR